MIMSAKHLRYLILIIVMICIGGAIVIKLISPNYFKSYKDCQVVVSFPDGTVSTVFVRENRIKFLGLKKEVIFSPENIAANNWKFVQSRDLKYVGRHNISYEFNGCCLILHLCDNYQGIDSLGRIPLLYESKKQPHS